MNKKRKGSLQRSISQKISMNVISINPFKLNIGIIPPEIGGKDVGTIPAGSELLPTTLAKSVLGVMTLGFNTCSIEKFS